ncbi:hypothetical protein [Thermoactinospora rubra]|uniref:hypothetical protein n=1 Tax=Thermoactinospora rubra TaxID=1088767 RepID=UPI001181605D|nr:hypothetical protein [Thermoactinospora rubra]
MSIQTQAAKGRGLHSAFSYVATLGAVAVLVQAVTAGQLLGDGSAGMHGIGAGAVHLVGLAQLVAALLLWRPGRGPAWPALVSAAILLLGFAQSMTGGSGAVALHVPLGMAIFGLNLWLALWSWTGPR